MTEVTPVKEPSCSMPVAVVIPSHAAPVQFVSEIGRLRKLREFYKKDKQEAFDKIRDQIENERNKVRYNVDQLQTLIEHNGSLIDMLALQQNTVSTALKRARDHVTELKMEIQQQSHNQHIHDIETAAKKLLSEFESEK